MNKKSDFNSLLDTIEAEAKAEGEVGLEQMEALTDYYSLFNQFLELRKKRKMTQKELAAASGIDQSEISRIEKGAANPTLATLESLVRALGGALRIIDHRERIPA
ncbi:MAG: helix-turn-helix domain-containing protein [Chloroflexota bacterium]